MFDDAASASMVADQPKRSLRDFLSAAPAPAAIASALLAFCLYAVTLAGTYVYDDVEIIQNSPRVHAVAGWIGFFHQPYMPGSPDPLWRPLPCMSYWAQWQLGGDKAWLFHLVNILLHAGVSALIAVLAWRLTRLSAAAWWAGLLFAAHPVHVEAVAYLVGRAESLCTLGVLGGLVIFSRPYTGRRVAAIIACFALAALSKEHGVLLPPMILVMYLCRHRVEADRAALLPSERQALKWLFVGLSFGTLAYAMARESIMHLYWEAWFLRWTVNPIVRAHGLDRVLLPLSILGRYTAILLFPWRPSPDYGARVTYFIVPWTDPYIYIGAATALLCAAAFAIALRRRANAVLVCLACLAIAYALISNTFMMIGIVMGERLIYLTSAFVILLAAMALARLPRRGGIAVGVLIIGLMSLRTATYAWRWNDALRLFSMSRREHPQAVYLYVMEANQLLTHGQLDEAERVSAAARILEPESANVWAVSAEVAKQRGDPNEIEYGRRAFDLEQNPPQSPRRLTHSGN